VLCCAKEGEVKRKRALCMGSLQGQAGAANANVSCAIFFFHILFPYLKALLQIIGVCHSSSVAVIVAASIIASVLFNDSLWASPRACAHRSSQL